MTDGYVLERIGGIVHEKVNNQTKTPTFGWMPLSYVKILSAEAYALLVSIRKELLGLKRMEAEAVLKFFPPSGYLKGRHTTDEFMMRAWKRYANGVVSKWSRRKRIPFSQAEREKLVESWIETRVRRARRFRINSHNTKTK
ncbi:MAG TPA: hypothetical protein VGR53_00575 [Nitrososphaerales archaeon]|nr:hypothetical protein [Nitrososphaerales archaeon]